MFFTHAYTKKGGAGVEAAAEEGEEEEEWEGEEEDEETIGFINSFKTCH